MILKGFFDILSKVYPTGSSRQTRGHPMEDSTQKWLSVSFALKESEQERLNILLARTGNQPLQRWVNHFSYVMVRSEFCGTLFKPILPATEEPSAGRKFIKLEQDVYPLMERLSENRSTPLSQLIRLFCVRSIELCENHAAEVMPSKEEIEAWIKERSEETEKPVQPPRQMSWFRGIFSRHK